MDRHSMRTSRPTWMLYLACYALCLGIAVLATWLIFEGRDTMFVLAVRLRSNPWVLKAVDQFSVVTFGLVWLVAILWVEHHLRQSAAKGLLWRRAMRIVMVEVALLGMCYGLQFVFG